MNKISYTWTSCWPCWRTGTPPSCTSSTLRLRQGRANHSEGKHCKKPMRIQCEYEQSVRIAGKREWPSRIWFSLVSDWLRMWREIFWLVQKARAISRLDAKLKQIATWYSRFPALRGVLVLILSSCWLLLIYLLCSDFPSWCTGILNFTTLNQITIHYCSTKLINVNCSSIFDIAPSTFTVFCGI